MNQDNNKPSSPNNATGQLVPVSNDVADLIAVLGDQSQQNAQLIATIAQQNGSLNANLVAANLNPDEEFVLTIQRRGIGIVPDTAKPAMSNDTKVLIIVGIALVVVLTALVR